MIRTLTLIILMGMLSACGPRLSVHSEAPRSPKDAIRSWTDAYNSDQLDALSLLVHPRQRIDFKRRRAAIAEQLKVWRVDRFRVKRSVRVNNEFSGYEFILQLHDGRREKEFVGIVVETKGQWWLWSY